MADPRPPAPTLARLRALEQQHRRSAAALEFGANNPHVLSGEHAERARFEARLHRAFAADLAALIADLTPARCDCGAPLTVCASCAVADYQAAHTDCSTCCPPVAGDTPAQEPQTRERTQADYDREREIQMAPPAQEPPPMKYRKKPVVIEAMLVPRSVRNADDDPDEFVRFMGADRRNIGWTRNWRTGQVRITTLEGTMTAEIGDWIIRGVKGEFYPCKPDIFAATYEPAGAAPTPDGETREKYYELLLAVVRKFPNETRHETALRYIRQAEASASDPRAAGPAVPPEKE